MNDIKREIKEYLGTLPPLERIIISTDILQELDGYYLSETTTFGEDRENNSVRLQIFVRFSKGMLETDDKAKKLIKILINKFQITDISKFLLGKTGNFWTYSINFTVRENNDL